MSDQKYGSIEETPMLPFPVVGIGASAGGLEALQDVFSSLTTGTNMAFFVVQHLSPDFKSMMVQILQRHTQLDVLHAEDGLTVTSGHVYLLPPKKDVRIRGRRIELNDRPAGTGLHLPIDLFLESLAKAQGKSAVAVILSGTGTDGSRGIVEIRKRGGLVMVQDPTTAKFDGMPRSAIATGAVDFVLSPFGLAEQLDLLPGTLPAFTPSTETEPLRIIFQLVSRETRLDLTFYKEGTLFRRIQRRMSLVGMDNLSDYAQTLQQDEKELKALCVDLLIGVTRFFRDPDAWEQLTEQVLRPLIREDRETRMWVAGCSTGQEAYSLAMAMHEAAIGLTVDPKVRIFATDANPGAIRIAMAGEYSPDDLEGVPEEIRAKYFEPHDEGFRVRRFLRDDITFAVHNLLTDPPFTRLDLVTCRNLLIYLKPDAQRPVLARLHFGLQNGGVLFLGPSETVGDQKGSFQPIDLKWKVFRASGATRDLARMFGATGLTTFGRPPARRPTPEVEFKPALDHYLPPGVAVDQSFDVLHVIGNITPFIQLPEGRANLNLLNLLPPAVSVFLNSTARRVRGNQEHAVIPSVELNGQMVDLRVMPANGSPTREDQGLMIFFEEIRAPSEGEGEASTFDLSSESAVRIEELKAELVLTRENLRTAVEDLEATNEELQATNEELIASNEELQSTNEELQSVNEELYTVNAEYQEKIEELEYLTGDLENLLRSIDVGALFLDSELRVRRFNDTVLRLLPLRTQDLGRSLSDLVLHAEYPSFHEHVNEVLTSREPRTSRVVASDGTVWSVQIRPFDDTHRLSRGVIVMFHDQTAWDAQQERIGELTANELAAGLAGVGMVLVDLKRQSTQLSDVARSLLGLSDGENLGYEEMHTLLAGDSPGGDLDAENVLPTDTLRSHQRSDGTKVVLRVFAQRVVHEASDDPQVLVALQKVRL